MLLRISMRDRGRCLRRPRAGGRKDARREGCAALPRHIHEGNASVPRCGHEVIADKHGGLAEVGARMMEVGSRQGSRQGTSGSRRGTAWNVRLL